MKAWLVKRGTLIFALESNEISIIIDPDGSPSCLLTVLDAREVSDIFMDYGRQLWERLGRPTGSTPIFTEISVTEFRWKIENEVVEILLNDTSDFLQVTTTTTVPIKLSYVHASEMAQAIQRIAPYMSPDK